MNEADLIAPRPAADVPAGVPNLFIIGAAKAGTTSLAAALAAHPNVAPGVTKELRYLMDPVDPLARQPGYWDNGLAGYAELFDPDPQSTHLLDASPQYYYQDTAQQVIPGIPGAHAILIMRDPTKRLVSLYNYAKFTQLVLPPDMTFQAFVREIEKGDSSDVVRGRRMLREAFAHGEYVRYARDWIRLLGNARLVPVIFEEFARNPRATTREISARVGLRADFFDSYDFTVRNPSHGYRSPGLHRLARTLSRAVPSHRVLAYGKAAYRRVNRKTTAASYTPEDLRCMAEIRERYAPWNAELAELLGVDAPIWK